MSCQKNPPKDQGALLDAICEELNDNTQRLVYADYLEEKGGALNEQHARLIRLQCGQGHGSPAEQQEIQELQGELIASGHPDFAIPEWCQGCTFRRGFRDGLMLTYKEFLRHADYFAAQRPPITEAHLTLMVDAQEDILTALPEACRRSNISTLNVSHNRLGNLTTENGDLLFRGIFNAVYQVPGIKKLDLSNNEIGIYGSDAGWIPGILEPFEDRLRQSGLETLDLSYNFIGHGTDAANRLSALMLNMAGSKITALNLRHNRTDNNRHAQSVFFTLTNNLPNTKLKHLDLSSNMHGVGDRDATLQSFAYMDMPTLEHFDLAGANKELFIDALKHCYQNTIKSNGMHPSLINLQSFNGQLPDDVVRLRDEAKAAYERAHPNPQVKVEGIENGLRETGSSAAI